MTDAAPAKYWLYTCRHGDDVRLLPWTSDGYARARALQDQCNNCMADEAAEDGWEVDGSEEAGYFSIDDGGSIRTIEVDYG